MSFSLINKSVNVFAYTLSLKENFLLILTSLRVDIVTVLFGSFRFVTPV